MGRHNVYIVIDRASGGGFWVRDAWWPPPRELFMTKGTIDDQDASTYHENGFVLLRGMFDATEIGLLSLVLVQIAKSVCETQCARL